MRHLFVFFLFISPFVIQAQEDAIIWQKDTISLATFKAPDSTAKIVWDIDELLAKGMDHTSNFKDTILFDKWRLNYRLTIGDYMQGNTITGYTIKAETQPKPKAGWEYSPFKPSALGRCMETLLLEEKLIVAVYSPIASGSDLVCVNLSTGREIWHAEVEQLLVEHSKYLNNIHLKQFGNSIVLVGNELGGCYVQIFDLSTGEKQFSGKKSKYQ